MSVKARKGQLKPMYTGMMNLSKIGSKDKETVKKLARAMRQVHMELIELDQVMTALMNGHAKLDEEGNMIPNKDGKGIEVENETMFSLKQAELLIETVQLELEPIQEVELDKFNKYPDAETLALCGPVIALL